MDSPLPFFRLIRFFRFLLRLPVVFEGVWLSVRPCFIGECSKIVSSEECRDMNFDEEDWLSMPDSDLLVSLREGEPCDCPFSFNLLRLIVGLRVI